jgi:MerR family transcriptional regulator, copper efflux regulator
LSKGEPVKIRELTELTGITPRQVRYLIAEGLMPPPSGGRATAEYGDEHVSAIRRYQRLRSLGFLPSAIKVLVGRGAAIPLGVTPGITLHIDPEILDRPIDTREIANRVADVLQNLIGEVVHDETES